MVHVVMFVILDMCDSCVHTGQRLVKVWVNSIPLGAIPRFLSVQGVLQLAYCRSYVEVGVLVGLDRERKPFFDRTIFMICLCIWPKR